MQQVGENHKYNTVHSIPITFQAKSQLALPNVQRSVIELYNFFLKIVNLRLRQ